MFIPTNQAMTDYFNSPEGAVLKDRFNTWADVPTDVLPLLLKRHMRTSLIESVPSRFSTMVDEDNSALPVKKSDIVSTYVGTNGVVYQTSDVKYVIANNNLWASPLDQQLRNTLVANLSTQLPGWVVASQPLGSAQDTLNVTVTEFNGRYDGKVIVSGEWLLNHQGQLIKRPFRLEGVQTQDGYDEMVKVLASVWSQEAASIAQEIKRLP